jgi:hypothetical protein
VENMITTSSLNPRIDDIVVIDSIAITTYMSSFLKPLLDSNVFDIFVKVVDAFIYEVILPSK